jgi:type I restriction enzyme S subunit
MKKGWEINKFEDCIDLVKYTNKILSKNYLEKGLYPIISQESELINGYWNKYDDVFKISKPIIVFGDHTKVIKYIDFD